MVHNTKQNSSDIFPLILQTIIIPQMLSTGREWTASDDNDDNDNDDDEMTD